MTGGKQPKQSKAETQAGGRPSRRSKQCHDEAAAVLSDECDDSSSSLTDVIKEAIVNLLGDDIFLQKFVDAVRDKLLSSIHDSLCEEIKRSLDFDIEERDAKITALENEVKTLKTEKSQAVQALQKETKNLEAQVDDLEQYSRRNCLVFTGVEEKAGENTTATIINICRKDLGTEVLPSDVDRSHRLGPSQPHAESVGDRQPPSQAVRPRKKMRNIIVKFTNYNIREKVYSARKELHNSSTTPRVFINENLTKTRSSLFWKIRGAAKNSNHKVWTQDGVIIVKTPTGGRIKVSRENHISRLTDLNF